MHSPEWYAARCAKVTASMSHVFMGTPRTKGKTWPDAAETYALQLSRQMLTANVKVGWESEAMRRGNDLEPAAIDWYRQTTGLAVRHNTWPIDHPTEVGIAATPDGLCEAGLSGVQVKCPNSEAEWMRVWHIKAVGDVPKAYYWQCQFEMWLMSEVWQKPVKWWDLLFYDPEFGVKSEGRIVRLDPNFDELAVRAVLFRDYVWELTLKAIDKEILIHVK